LSTFTSMYKNLWISYRVQDTRTGLLRTNSAFKNLQVSLAIRLDFSVLSIILSQVQKEIIFG